MPRDLGHPAISTDGWRVSVDPSLRELPPDELVGIIQWQANQIRILKKKASQRATLLEDLRRQLADAAE